MSDNCTHMKLLYNITEMLGIFFTGFSMIPPKSLLQFTFFLSGLHTVRVRDVCCPKKASSKPKSV